MQFEIALSSKTEQGIALVLAVIPLLGLGSILWAFIGGQIERHEQAASLARKLALSRAVMAQEPTWDTQLSQLRSSPEWRALYVPKSQDGAAAAIIASAGAKVLKRSMHRMEPVGAVEIDETVVFSANTEQLTRVLQSMRGLAPVFVVRALSIESAVNPQGPAGTAPSTLHVELTVAEFERPS